MKLTLEVLLGRAYVSWRRFVASVLFAELGVQAVYAVFVASDAARESLVAVLVALGLSAVVSGLMANHCVAGGARGAAVCIAGGVVGALPVLAMVLGSSGTAALGFALALLLVSAGFIMLLLAVALALVGLPGPQTSRHSMRCVAVGVVVSALGTVYFTASIGGVLFMYWPPAVAAAVALASLLVSRRTAVT